MKKPDLVERILELAEAARPEVYRRYLLGLPVERLEGLARDLEAERPLPRTMAVKAWSVSQARGTFSPQMAQRNADFKS
jgi:hypothetical protein